MHWEHPTSAFPAATCCDLFPLRTAVATMKGNFVTGHDWIVIDSYCIILILRLQVQLARVVLDCAALAHFLAARCLCQTIGVNFGGRAASRLQQATGFKALQEFRLVHFLAAEHSPHTVSEGLRERNAKKGQGRSSMRPEGHEALPTRAQPSWRAPPPAMDLSWLVV